METFLNIATRDFANYSFGIFPKKHDFNGKRQFAYIFESSCRVGNRSGKIDAS